MKITLSITAALFLGTLYLVGRVAFTSECAMWHRGDPWTFPVFAMVAANAIIGVCYLAIPGIVLYYAVRLRGAHLPTWLSLLALSLACFVLWCGATHWDAVFARPVVFCTESLLVKLATAVFSLIGLAGFAICTQPILLLASIVARSKVFAPILDLESPFKTVAVLRQIAEELDRDR